jgi:hypothetical protein
LPVIGVMLHLVALVPVTMGFGTAEPVSVPADARPAESGEAAAPDTTFVSEERGFGVGALAGVSLALFALGAPLLSAGYLALRLQPLRETIYMARPSSQASWTTQGVV